MSVRLVTDMAALSPGNAEKSSREDGAKTLHATEFGSCSSGGLDQSTGTPTPQSTHWSTAERLLLAACARQWEGDQNWAAISKHVIQVGHTLGAQYSRHEKEFYAATKCARQYTKLIEQLPKQRRGSDIGSNESVGAKVLASLSNARIRQLEESLRQRRLHIAQLRAEIDKARRSTRAELLRLCSDERMHPTEVKVGPVKEGTYSDASPRRPECSTLSFQGRQGNADDKSLSSQTSFEQIAPPSIEMEETKEERPIKKEPVEDKIAQQSDIAFPGNSVGAATDLSRSLNSSPTQATETTASSDFATADGDKDVKPPAEELQPPMEEEESIKEEPTEIDDEDVEEPPPLVSSDAEEKSKNDDDDDDGENNDDGNDNVNDTIDKEDNTEHTRRRASSVITSTSATSSPKIKSSVAEERAIAERPRTPRKYERKEKPTVQRRKESRKETALASLQTIEKENHELVDVLNGIAAQMHALSAMKPFQENARTKASSETTRVLKEILRKLSKCTFAVGFRKPVSEEEVPKYYKVIKYPEDISSLRQYITENDVTPEAFKATVFRIAANAMIFNGRDSEFYQSAHRLKEECKFLFESFGMNEKASSEPQKRAKRKRTESDEEVSEKDLEDDAPSHPKGRPSKAQRKGRKKVL